VLKRYFQDTSKYFITFPSMGDNWVESEQTDIKWYDFDLKVQPVPKAGKIDFFIHGLCSNGGKVSKSFPAFRVKFPDGNKTVDKKLPTVSNMGAVPRPQFTGLELAYIPDPDEETPKTDIYYQNGTLNKRFKKNRKQIIKEITFNLKINQALLCPLNPKGVKNWKILTKRFGKLDLE